MQQEHQSAERNNGGITRSERDSLLQVARLRARVAKDQVVAFAASGLLVPARSRYCRDSRYS